MGRVPCCDHMGMKKGPWTQEEDRILVSFIQKHGIGNWRALPKQAGLLRCGKSCRLRWTNYLRPDVKRGGFSKEEEDAIIYLHAKLGNRWSAIAAKLPGRTDNDIKNVWHTQLKKRLNLDQAVLDSRRRNTTKRTASSESDPSRRSMKEAELVNLVVVDDDDDDNSTAIRGCSEEEEEGDLQGRRRTSNIDDDLWFWKNMLAEAGNL